MIPALADYQQELREAGANPIRQLTAHVRGYAAFARLVLAAPFIVPSAPMGSPITTFVVGKHGGNLLLVLALALFAAIRPLFGWFAVAVIGLGIALAIALRVWHTRHPDARGEGRTRCCRSCSSRFLPRSGRCSAGSCWRRSLVARSWRRAPALEHPASERARASDGRGRVPGAEINLSAIPVAGDIGGLLFVIGAIVTVLLGLPDIRWFVLGSVVVGAVLAGGLFVWRSSQTRESHPRQFDPSAVARPVTAGLKTRLEDAPPLQLPAWSLSSNRSAPAAIATSDISLAIAPRSAPC